MRPTAKSIHSQKSVVVNVPKYKISYREKTMRDYVITSHSSFDSAPLLRAQSDSY
jgi:hypothetical protein